jgi:hypothetical protein
VIATVFPLQKEGNVPGIVISRVGTVHRPEDLCHVIHGGAACSKLELGISICGEASFPHDPAEISDKPVPLFDFKVYK